MKNNKDEETNNNIPKLSKSKPSNKILTDEVTKRKYAFNHDKAQCSVRKEKQLLLGSNNMKYMNNSGEETSCHKKLNRNMGEHYLFKDVEYTQSIKDFCFTNNSGINLINEEKNIVISTGNSKLWNQQTLVNNDKKTKLLIRENCTNQTNNNFAHMLTSNIKMNEDKTTYCRPVLNYYNQQFIYKTMERNAKLKNLVKKLSIARQREKEKVNWNNFINELKNRHWYDHDDTLLEEYVTPEIIDDCSCGHPADILRHTTFSWQKSKLCRNLLQDIYGSQNTFQPNRIYERCQQPPQNIKYLPHNTNSFCYPTSSIGRLMVLRRNQENYKYLCKNKEPEKISYNNRDANALLYDNKSCVVNPQSDKHINLNHFKSTLVQVDNALFSPLINNIRQNKTTSNSEVVYRHISNEKNRLDDVKLENTNNTSLVNIENKLEYLIEAINKFMVQIKSHKRPDRDSKCTTVPCKTAEKLNRKFNMIKSGSLGIKEEEYRVVGEITTHDSESTVTTADGLASDNLREVETLNSMNNQNKHKIKLYKQTCSLQTSIEVPTKDCCTEVTKSLCKQGSGDEIVTIEEIITPKRTPKQEKMLPLQHITIAVNTDPLSFLALLRFSTETIKRLMSYIPNFDYLSYLSSLNFLQTPRTTVTNCICKICGAAFDNPAKLNDHIHRHDLGKTRDCCVCRHVLKRTRTSLFSCQYCGQHFTRAYCCELHQQSCAKRLGRCHNVASSLMLLR